LHRTLRTKAWLRRAKCTGFAVILHQHANAPYLRWMGRRFHDTFRSNLVCPFTKTFPAATSPVWHRHRFFYRGFTRRASAGMVAQFLMLCDMSSSFKGS
jgi:hypothetical protein